MSDPWFLTVAGIRMDDTPDAEGVRWTATVDGWDSPAVRTDEGDFTGRHGAWGSLPLYGARALTVTGLAKSPDMATAFRVRDRLHLMPPTSESRTLIYHESVPKQVTVWRAGAPRSSDPIDNGTTHLVRWSLSLSARDPFKKALTPVTTPVSAGATVTIESPGTETAELVVTLVTAGTVDLAAGGLRFTTSALPAGAVIDVASQTVRAADGSDLSGAVVRYGSPGLPAGGGTVKQAGTASLSVKHFDTYA